MTLKAVLFDFNGVIINDEPLHRELINEILIAENLRFNPAEYQQFCLGRSDRACLRDLLANRGRVVSDSYLTQLISRKAQAYEQKLESVEKLPIYPGLDDLIFKIRAAQVKIAVVSGALRSEVELVLNRAKLAQYFSAIVGGDDITASKPEPDGYLLAVERLNQQYPSLNLKPAECLAIEDTLVGIQAAKRAGVKVVGVAHTYPFHMLQRWANWAVDYLYDLEIERVQQVFSRTAPPQPVK
ncbi:HAD family phosphatase [Microcoleus sp. FACHB-831]|uniref:HAD family hydrolase n=1 Tax=Microcoleus sp. FACHB-831 TaxID=2692827 RepID=UPI001683B2A2|nr:HAD family phosphatase [Microcoleus sp. FACHB-831]MBD1921342.1 HAD family phosphatase [Microcoleus sp. FACHB-831]